MYSYVLCLMKQNMSFVYNFNFYFVIQIFNLEKKILIVEKYDWFVLILDNYRYVSNWFLQICDFRCVMVERFFFFVLGLRQEVRVYDIR